MIHLMLKYIPYRISLNKVIIILNQANTVLPPNSRFLGPGIFRELEIRELKI